MMCPVRLEQKNEHKDKGVALWTESGRRQVNELVS